MRRTTWAVPAVASTPASRNVGPDAAAQQGIKFSFAPPYSPHFNGIAEAAVRSTKYHLRRLMQMTHFTYEELTTCLTQIEAVLNSRPLTPLSSDPADLSALTPSLFLIGRSLLSVPYPQVTNMKVEQLQRYERINYMKQHFWKRFSKEYVSLLQTKTKWFHSTGNLSVGTLVLLKEAGQPPLLWPLGRVTKIYPGVDGGSRVAELKMKGRTVLRSYKNISMGPSLCFFEQRCSTRGGCSRLRCGQHHYRCEPTCGGTKRHLDFRFRPPMHTRNDQFVYLQLCIYRLLNHYNQILVFGLNNIKIYNESNLYKSRQQSSSKRFDTIV
ncbi:PREDICTED: uncharacterized protein LOC106123802 [Papilio xuthus]|uniref:Uncharacterized protein LOC106123802 n=1 Tax=Papilio xuthus TaxID=66420 RepID=A0AAJ6ZMB2_PAPXU|nr:PREDICTED: uncharacterized protein LOC106123802 [Papilio xuthus]